MLYLLIWWVLVMLLGFAVLPVTMRFLRFLPDRGYAFAKPMALLLWVYPFWLLAVLGFAQNTFGALAIMLAAVAILSWGLLRGTGQDAVLSWLRAHWKYALVVELVFGATLLAFAYFRAFNPEISATEKPMEYMFLNSILQSKNFPPRDAWLSGFSISYYYLGYVIVASLAKLGSVPSGYAFNLGLIMTFALAAVGAFGLIFNVVTHALSGGETRPARRSAAPYVFGLLAVFMLLVIGNLQGAVEVVYNAKIGDNAFYQELNLHGLHEVTPSGTGIPTDNWWWWRASRVLNDINPVGGGHVEVIDEFPAFSFLLGDLHPHVLALPFGVLALAIALNLLLRPQASTPWNAERLDVNALAREFLSPRMLLTALAVGALGMLNTWDIVTYGVVIAAAFAIADYRNAGRWSGALLMRAATFFVVMYAGGVLLFLPFFLGFSSQASGIVPNIFNRTPLHQYLIMWGMFVFSIAVFLGVLAGQARDKKQVLGEWVQFAVPLLAVPVVIALAGVIVLMFAPSLGELLANATAVDPNNLIASVTSAFARTFVVSPGTFLLLVILIAGVVALGRIELRASDNSQARTAVVYALLLALVGLTLTFGVEFLFIRDGFGTRMNTVFKLYYQAWLLLAMAATFAAFYIWQSTRGVKRAIWAGAFGAMFLLSMIYPVLAYPNRADSFAAKPDLDIPTLDGWRWVQHAFPDDYAAIEWMMANAPRDAVILEAVGDSYSFDNRVSVATGLPTVLGWGGHELQWRGTGEQVNPRSADIATIYKSPSLQETRDLLARYGVDYVVVGGIERNKYQLNPALIDKFGKLGEKVFESGPMRIYQIGQFSVSFDSP